MTGSFSSYEKLDILVIDDDEAIRCLLALVLNCAGYTTKLAEHGKAGLSLLADHRFRLIVTDIMMPEADGLEFILGYQKAHPKIPVLAISGGGRIGEPEVMFRPARFFGCDRSLAKPFKLRDFLAAVEELLALPPCLISA